MELRPYQSEARAAVEDDWESGYLRTLLVLPTGCGKTIVFCKIIEDQVRLGRRALILAHRGELLEQAADKLAKATGLGCAVEKAEESCLGSWYRVVVGSVQSMTRESRLSRFKENYFDVIVVDEAHHCLSDSYQRVLDHFGGARVLGVTATPDRGDMRNLGQYFEHLAYEYTLPRAIKEGFLCPIKAVTIPLKLDLTGVGIQAGDFKNSDIDTALDPYLHQIADEMVHYCADRKTVVFLPLVKTSQKFRNILNTKGFQAAEVNGGSADRSEVLQDFADGKYNVLCNSMLLTEGWDCPPVDCIVVLRPTKVRSLYSQMVGRGTRLSPETGKDHLLLLDFLWHTERHELCHPADLICENEEVAKKMTEQIQAAGCPVDIEEAEKKASDDVVREREESLAMKLEEMRGRKKKLVDPLQFEMSIQAEDLSSYVPAFGWEMSPPSDAQLKALEKYGIFPDEIDNAGKASMLLDRLKRRSAEGLTTPRQIRVLERFHFRNVGTWQFYEAKNMIDRLAASAVNGHWRVPPGINAAEYVPPSLQTNQKQERRAVYMV
ncbi:MAG: DEAD/DEAH box helicase [Oscillibacter sp.]|nr:DEAD/DEAH box helicase [Oscillibacter sp.]